MMPGSTSQPPVEFPEEWCGLWKDALGAVFHVHRVKGRILHVSFAERVEAPFSPLPWGGTSATMTAMFVHEPAQGLRLIVETGPPDESPRLILRFLIFLGERSRFAEPTDHLQAVVMEPQFEGYGTGWEWVASLRHCHKADGDLPAYLQAH